MKKYIVTILLDIVEIEILATTPFEAKQKAIEKLSKKNPAKLIRRNWPDNKKEISIEEV